MSDADLSYPTIENVEKTVMSDITKGRSDLFALKSFIESIDQCPRTNVWSVRSDDPEIAVCDALDAVERLLSRPAREGGE